METVANLPDLTSATLRQSVLRARGIATLIPDEYLASLDWRLGTALQGIRLQVAPADVERAKWLLAQTSPAPDEGDESDAAADRAEQETCPRCESTSVGPPPWKRRLRKASFLWPALVFLWPIFAFATRQRICFSCGLTWDRELPRTGDPR